MQRIGSWNETRNHAALFSPTLQRINSVDAGKSPSRLARQNSGHARRKFSFSRRVMYYAFSVHPATADGI